MSGTERELRGIRAIDRGARGRAVQVQSFRDLPTLPPDAIVIAEHATPDIVFVIEHVAGMVFATGGPASHAAILAREFAVPCVVGVDGATEQIPDGALVRILADGTVRFTAQ